MEDKGLQKNKSGVRVILKHPHLDPQAITDTLQISPTHSWGYKDPVVTPAGDVVGGCYGYTMWSWNISEAENKDVLESLERAIEILSPHKENIDDYKISGGRVSLIIDFDGSSNISIILRPDLMVEIVKLEINLEIEVFPNI